MGPEPLTDREPDGIAVLGRAVGRVEIHIFLFTFDLPFASDDICLPAAGAADLLRVDATIGCFNLTFASDLCCCDAAIFCVNLAFAAGLFCFAVAFCCAACIPLSVVFFKPRLRCIYYHANPKHQRLPMSSGRDGGSHCDK